MVVIGSDDVGLECKEVLKADLEGDDRVAAVIDIGVDPVGHAPYPTVAITAAEIVARGDADRALLMCGTGLGCGDRREQGCRHARRPRTRQLLLGTVCAQQRCTGPHLRSRRRRHRARTPTCPRVAWISIR